MNENWNEGDRIAHNSTRIVSTFGTCDECQAEHVELEEIELYDGDELCGRILICDSCKDQDEFGSWVLRANEREADKEADRLEMQEGERW